MDALEKMRKALELADEANRLRAEALSEIDAYIERDFPSKNRFFEVVPAGLITPGTWSKWVSGKMTPSYERLERLMPVFEDLLDAEMCRASYEVSSAGELDREVVLRIASVTNEASVEELSVMTAEAVEQARTVEFPRDPLEASLHRNRVLRLLSALSELLECEAAPYYALGAEAGFTLALLLAEMGDHKRAAEVCRTAAGAFEQILYDGSPFTLPPGYPERTYNELTVLAYQRASVSERRIGTKENGLLTKAGRLMCEATKAADSCPNKDRYIAGVERDRVSLLLKQHRLAEAEDAAKVSLNTFSAMKASDDPILFYVSLSTMAKVAVARGFPGIALDYISQAMSVEQQAKPGPIHQVLLLQNEAAAYRGEKNVDGWAGSIGMALKLALTAGLADQIEVIRRRLERMPESEQPRVKALLESAGLVGPGNSSNQS